MLLTCLQSHPIAELAIFIFRPSDDSSRHVPFVFVSGSKESSRRTAIEHGSAQTLCGSEHNIRSPFSWRSQQGKAQNIGGNSYLAICGMGFFCKYGIILYVSIRVRVLQNAGKHFR
jgi:hypothetical protein